MRYIWLIAWREFADHVRTRGFWTGVLMFPVILVLAIQIPVLIEQKAVPTRQLVVLDPAGQFAPVIQREVDRRRDRQLLDALRDYAARQLARPADHAEWLAQFTGDGDAALDKFRAAGGLEGFLAHLKSGLVAQAPPFKPPAARVRMVPSPIKFSAATPLADAREALRPWLRGERDLEVDGRPAKLFAAVLIPTNLVELANAKSRPAATNTAPAEAKAGSPAAKAGVEFWSENLAEGFVLSLVENTLNAELRRHAYLARGLDPATVQAIEQTRVPITSLNPKKAAGSERVGLADKLRQWLPSVFVYLLWVSLFSISQMLLTSVIEEKSNRIMEVLLSSVTPNELMTGKLFGIAAVGLAMLAAWLASLGAVIWWKASTAAPAATSAASGMATLPGDLAGILQTTWLLPAFVLYFLLGYVLYAGLFLALGSTCNTLKEAQNHMSVLMLVLMVPLFTMPFIPRDPNGTLATALSWFPFYTPFVMLNRIVADPPLRDVIGTLVLLIVFVAVELWAAAKIFRTGILRTGQPPRWIELLRWLRSGP